MGTKKPSGDGACGIVTASQVIFVSFFPAKLQYITKEVSGLEQCKYMPPEVNFIHNMVLSWDPRTPFGARDCVRVTASQVIFVYIIPAKLQHITKEPSGPEESR